jgi:mycoredoxin
MADALEPLTQVQEHEPALTICKTTTCGFWHCLKTQLGRVGIPYTDINIEIDRAAAGYVESVNGGNQVVPTVRCPNGTVKTNPSITDIKTCLPTTPVGS